MRQRGGAALLHADHGKVPRPVWRRWVVPPAGNSAQQGRGELHPIVALRPARSGALNIKLLFCVNVGNTMHMCSRERCLFVFSVARSSFCMHRSLVQ